MSENETAALAVVCMFGLPVLGWIVVRAFKFVERMEMIKRGMIPPDLEHRSWGRVAPPPPPPSSATTFVPNVEAQRLLRKGMMMTAIGVALLIGLSFIGVRDDGGWVPGPWLLGGLIPMFVGLAQIAMAVMSGAEFPRARTYVPPGSQYGAPPPPQQPPPASSGPYAYRPPGNQEELPRTKPPQQT